MISDSAAQTPLDVRLAPCRSYITERLADLHRIHTPEGIEVLEKVKVGDTDQWISIRGMDRSNPVLLMIHGGPGSPMMPTSWAFQKPWEDFFTVVQWDQRGVGKNYLDADMEKVLASLSFARLVEDTEQIVAYLRKRLNQEKIFVLGYSYGTRLGLELAKRRPDWLYAYAGVGQFVGNAGERRIYEQVLALAVKSGDAVAIEELQAVSAYPDAPHNEKKHGAVVRKWARFFNGGWYGKKNLDLFWALSDWAPEYSLADAEIQERATMSTTGVLVGRSSTGIFEGVDALTYDFKVPILILQGAHDLHTPHDTALEYFEKIHAPTKKFVTFRYSAHFPFLEEPGLFLQALTNNLLPLVGK